jgi:hypothetical protein
MVSQGERRELIAKIRALPDEVAKLVDGLSPAQLTARPLPGEWSVAQNVHHLVDSHMNSYVRCKLIMTEEHPTLRPFDQDRWAELPDASRAEIADSLAILRHLHARWVIFWERLRAGDWRRTGFHPDSGVVSLDDQLRTYAEHGEGHLDQIARTLAAGKASNE